jgi:hypothetical protein
VDTKSNGETPDAVSPSVNASGVSAYVFPYQLDLACFVAGTINSAFESGLNPAWFEVESLRNGGFLDAAFADGPNPLPTPSGKPPRHDWTLRARLNADAEEDTADTDWETVTTESAIRRWREYARTTKSYVGRARVLKLLSCVWMIEQGLSREAVNDVLCVWDFDGVDSDCFAQIAIGGDVIYG